MVLRKNGKIEGSNLRVLAIAFANNRIDRKNYLRLRTQQLSALEFSKPLPPLPPELLDISVPSVKIDAPHVSKKDNGPIIKWLVIALVALAAITVAYVGYFRIQSGSTVSRSPVPTPEQQAGKLLEMPAWPPEEMEIFTILWSGLSTEAKAEARRTEWFSALKNEIANRINQLKQQRGSTDDLRDYQNKLNALRVFYAEVAAE
jgi:hypothetical protein